MASDGISSVPAPEVAADDDVIGRWFLLSLAGIVLGAGLAVGAWFWFHRPAPPAPNRITQISDVKVGSSLNIPVPRVIFTDVTAEAGITFVHRNGDLNEALMPSTMGGGNGWFDYDLDGDLDLVLTNSSRWPWNPKQPGDLPAVTLYRNTGNWRFVDVTAEAGFSDSYFAMGVAIGDYDNDGDPDLFVAALGPNHLYRNDGGQFVDVGQTSGVAGPPDGFSTSAGWFDYDLDGDLDLFVCEYAKWSRQINMDFLFRGQAGVRGYINPGMLNGDFSHLYRNEGNGLFSDVSQPAGIQTLDKSGEPAGKALGVVFTDLNLDHKLDFVVANDGVANFAFINRGSGSFLEVASDIGVALGPDGVARAGMGIDIADFRNNGTQAVAIGNFANEMTALFVSHPFKWQPMPLNAIRFTDEAIVAGIGGPTRPLLTFGVHFFDYDLDGRQDLLQANGHVDDSIDKVEMQQQEQPAQLFWNAGRDAPVDYVEVTPADSGTGLFRPMVGRGASTADVDGDGDLDLLLTATGGPPRLLRNDNNLGHHWVRFKLIGKQASRDPFGALIELRAGGQTQQQRLSPTRSYLSQSEPAVTFGLGKSTTIDSLRVIWPGGKVQVVPGVQVDRVHVIEEAE
jgi:hypothetical protein